MQQMRDSNEKLEKAAAEMEAAEEGTAEDKEKAKASRVSS